MRLQYEIYYMMIRSLQLLLSDIRPKQSKFKNSINFGSIGGLPCQHNKPHPIHFQDFLFLINCRATLRSLNDYILPSAALPYELVYEIIEHPNTDSITGQIDWHETFKNMYKGIDKTAIRVRKQQISQEQAKLVTYLLNEFIIHARTISKHINENTINADSEYIQSTIIEIDQVINRVELLVNNMFAQYKYTNDMQNYEIENCLKNILLTYDYNYKPIFEEYKKMFRPKLSRRNFTTDFVKNLINLREQYLTCNIWLTEKLGFKFDQNLDKAHLYEFWCFNEFALVAQKIGFANTVQNSFISKNRKGPEFQLNSSYWAFFDYRSSRFNDVKAKQIFPPQIFNYIAALKSVYVEWFIKNVKNYEKSMIIDTKYGRWNSRELLKVLGYMTNYAVEKGVIIFRYNFPKGENVGRKITDGLILIETPSPCQKTLWVMNLVPSIKYEEKNRQILEIFIKHAFENEE